MLHERTPKSGKDQPPFRIGIRCDHEGVTLKPDDGIGVTVYNLAAGLAKLDEAVEVVLLVGPDYQGEFAPLARQSSNRVRIVPALCGAQRAPGAVSALELASLHTPLPAHTVGPGRTRRLRTALSNFPVLPGRVKQAGRQLLNWHLQRLRKFVPWSRRRRKLALFLLGPTLVVAPFAFLLAWSAYACYRLASSTGRGLLFPILPVLSALCRRLAARFAPALLTAHAPAHLQTAPPLSPIDSLAVARSSDCQVWIMPHAHFYDPLTFPAVALLHDLAALAGQGRAGSNGSSNPAGQSAQGLAETELYVCPSRFVAEDDLVRDLGLPVERLRVVAPAPPADFPELSEELSERLLPAGLTRPYLFFPADFEAHKNHRVLIEALHVLRGRHGVEELDLVFTGGRASMPAELRKLIEERGLKERVRVLGCVTRPVLGALYQHAFATIVPSLSEHDSLVIYEALYWKCPVACASIESFAEQCGPMREAMLYFDPHDPGTVADTILAIRDGRSEILNHQQETSRSLRKRTWLEIAREWLALCREAVEIHQWQKSLDRKLVEPWPRRQSIPAAPREPLEVFLFLQQTYWGGVWQQTMELVHELVAINRQRRRLTLTLGLHELQENTRSLERLGDEITLKWLRLNPIGRQEIRRMVDGDPAWLADRPEHEFCFFSGAAQAALRSDAWFALVDRFPLPLLPARPLGILVWDLLQKVVPGMFGTAFHRSMAIGMVPTARAADLIIATTPQTRDDVISEFGVDPERVLLLPIACNPHWRFSRIKPEPVRRVREPFVLNVTNCSKHKGAEVILRAHARLKRRCGHGTPQLVMCGWGTDGFAANYQGPEESYWVEVRQLVKELDLQEGCDLVFLGSVTDGELYDLFQRCRIVVNAASYDNGCLCLAEGAYFGKPAVSSQYPAAEFHRQRFDYPARFFPVGDDEALAEAMHAALQAKPADIERARARFADPEFGYRRYAERFYDALVQLAEQGEKNPISRLIRASA